MTPGIDDIGFLARSPHRIGILEVMGAAPADRRDLGEATGAAGPTLSRALSAFEGRHWVHREGPI